MQANQLCDFCKKRPKFVEPSGFVRQHCGKTCAQQQQQQQQHQHQQSSPQIAIITTSLSPSLSTMCDNCHQKPKFIQGSMMHAYCGKNCANAAATKPTQWGNVSSAPSSSSTSVLSSVFGHGSKTTKPSSGYTGPLLPSSYTGPLPTQSPPQWGNASSSSSASSSSFTMQGGAAHMKGAAQMLMVTTTTFRSSASKPAKPSSQNSRPSQALPPYKPAPSVGYAAPPTAAPASKTLDSSDDEATAPPQYSQRGTPPPRGNTPNAPIPPGVCIIPGCGQQVYKGSSGPSRFCSRGHGEEAVKTGLVSACIMCQKSPRRQIDWFCSSSCKAKASE